VRARTATRDKLLLRYWRKLLLKRGTLSSRQYTKNDHNRQKARNQEQKRTHRRTSAERLTTHQTAPTGPAAVPGRTGRRAVNPARPPPVPPTSASPSPRR